MLRRDYAIFTTSARRYLLLLIVNRSEFQSRSEATSDKEVQENDRRGTGDSRMRINVRGSHNRPHAR